MTPKNPRFSGSHLVAFTLLSIVLCASAAHAGWSEDMRLTYGHHGSQPEIIARGDTVHVAWQHISPSDSIFYIRSTDAGISWGSTTSLQAPGHLGWQVDLNLSGDRVLVAWHDIDTNLVNWVHNIAFSMSLGGDGWSQPVYIFHPFHGEDFEDYSAELAVDTVNIVYSYLYRDSSGYRPMKFLRSTDLGETWENEITLGYLNAGTNPLEIAQCGGRLYIVWSGDAPPEPFEREVHALVSTDGGRSWSGRFLISSEDFYLAQQSCTACDNETGAFAVGWMDYGLSGDYPGDLFVRLTTDGGYTWRPESHATTHHGVTMSSLAIIGDSLWAIWSDRDPAYGLGNEEICFSKSTDLGASWSPYERLTFEPEHSFAPGIAYDGGKLHVVWYNDNPPPDSGMDIYYKCYDPEPDVVIENQGTLPGRISISAYPNPLNSTTVITFSNLKGGEIKIFDIKGRSIKTFFTGGENEGKIEWDATDASGKKVCSGIYFARANTSQKSQAIKLIYLK